MTPSTTTSVTVGGAASSIAPLMASWTVTVEEGQPSQLPSRRKLGDPLLRNAQIRHPAGVRPEVRTHLIEGPLDPLVHVQRVQVVQQQEALHQRVLEQAIEDAGSRRAFRAERGHDVAQPVAVQSQQQPNQFLAALAVDSPPSDARMPSNSSTRAPTCRASAIRLASVWLTLS